MKCPICCREMRPIGDCGQFSICHEEADCVDPKNWKQWGWRCNVCTSDFPLDAKALLA